jgi:undecaprenyl-diphosphatase
MRLKTTQTEDAGRSKIKAANWKSRSPIAMVEVLDLACLKALGALNLPKAISLPLIVLVRIGDGWIWCLVAFYLWWAMPLSMNQSKFAVFHCLLTIGISLCLYWPVKLLIRRPRPGDSGLGVVARVPPLDKYSFPSGHTMNNLAVVLTLSLYLPRLFYPALLLPLALGGLRVLFGVHFLSDVVAGGALGFVSFYLAKMVFPFLF